MGPYLMKAKFYSIFQANPDGSYKPVTDIKINGVTINSLTKLKSGNEIASFDIGHHVGRDLDVKVHPDGIIEIEGFYIHPKIKLLTLGLR